MGYMTRYLSRVLLRRLSIALLLCVVCVVLPSLTPAANAADPLPGFYSDGDPEAPVCSEASQVCVVVHGTEATAFALTGAAQSLVPDDVTFAFLPQAATSQESDDAESATGCNLDVCISVSGKGRRVSAWSSSASQSKADGCVRPAVQFQYRTPGSSTNKALATYYWNGPCQSVHPGASSGRWVAQYKAVPSVFGDRYQLCNAWNSPPFAGNPCILIKG